MTIFNNTKRHIYYHLQSPNGNSGVLIHSGTFQKITRLGPMDECVITGNPGSAIRLTRPDITDKLVVIDGPDTYEPHLGFVGWVEQKVIRHMNNRGMHFYLN